MSSSYDEGKNVGDESVVSVTGGGAEGDVSIDLSSFSSNMVLPSSVGDTSRINGVASRAGHSKQSREEGAASGQQHEEDLWGSILNSVKSSRAVPVKNVIMLGASVD